MHADACVSVSLLICQIHIWSVMKLKVVTFDILVSLLASVILTILLGRFLHIVFKLMCRDCTTVGEAVACNFFRR